MHNHDHEGCGCNHDNNEGCCGGGNHDHDHGGCGCHDHGEYQMIQLSLEDGREVSAAVLEVFELNDKEYIALLPVEEENVLLYQFKEDEDGVELINIESDEEFEAVSQAFFELMGSDDEDYEEYEEEDEE